MIKESGNCLQRVVRCFVRHSLPIMSLLLLLVTSLFIFLVFKNIQYPLLWNDEGETMVFAERILSYGFPKADDGKNTLNLCEFEKRDLCVRQGLGAYVFEPWIQFYIAVPGAFLAHNFTDIYLKTALARIPFTLIGCLSLIIFGLTITKLYKEGKQKLFFIALFIFLEALSPFLLLHLRQARSYPVTLLFSAIIIYLYVNHNFLKKFSLRTYNISIITLLFLLFHLFYPVYIIFIVTFTLHVLITFTFSKNRRSILRSFMPYALSVITILPSLWFFNTIPIVFQAKESFSFLPSRYFILLKRIIYFFSIYEFLLPIIYLKTIIISCFAFSAQFRKYISSSLHTQVSLLFTLLFVVSVLIIPYGPYFYFRYTLPLQPILTMVLLLDLCVTIVIFKKIKRRIKYFAAPPLLILLVLSLAPSLSVKPVLFINYLREISVAYKGPLDFIIPYIKSNYNDPKNLIIATNYEEPSYIYYLDSKIIVGHTGINLEKDRKIAPDIIILRRYIFPNSNVIKDLISEGNYKKTPFPIFDYPVNNIPELILSPFHLFSTKYTNDPNEMLEIYEKIH